MMERSSRLRRKRSTRASRLAISRRISTSGYLSQNGPSSIGTKYLAVVTQAMRSRPRFKPRMSAMVISNRDQDSNTAREAASSSRPASVRLMVLPICSNKGMPTSSASWRICAGEPRAPECDIIQTELVCLPGSCFEISFIIACATSSVQRDQASTTLL